MTKDLFISSVASLVMKDCREYGYKVASPIIAQSILESSCGTSLLSAKYNNHFGLKCGAGWKGQSVNLATREEFSEGTLTNIRDNFRVYDSFAEGVRGYFEFLKYARYANLKDIDDPQKFLETIVADGYATDSRYVAKCEYIIDKYDLTQYDALNTSAPTQEAYCQCAMDCIAGKYGNGEERMAKVTRAGFRYDKVQKIVNALCS